VNDRHEARNRQRFAATGTISLNCETSPGSGKTKRLVSAIAVRADPAPVAVIEGDQQTSVDADRIGAAGDPVVRFNSGLGCHVGARMVGHALDRLPAMTRGFWFIEIDGNLVCPAAFDFGEAANVAIVSVADGDDKPLKYPDIFAAASVILVNRIDLAPHVDTTVVGLIANPSRVNLHVDVPTVFARSGERREARLAWLGAQRMCWAG